jgi:membrane fusion protein (multidrug efflux system)
MEKSTKKAMITMLVILAVLFAIIFIYKAIGGYFAKRAMAANASIPITVSATKVQYQQWQPHLEAVGSLRAVQGVNVTSELSGLVRTIYFDPGAIVKKGDLLVELNIDADVAQLHSLQAQADLAGINYRRDQAQYAIAAISKAVLDTSLATLQSNQAQVDQQTATIAKKLIREAAVGGTDHHCLLLRFLKVL